ncbi:hypothetical protein BJ742DRAFT_767893 [Cladochytrium replicatum]|nr:hypothetical protein BJ742DRAFT_767893 [Cladochytrium replicatum]
MSIKRTDVLKLYRQLLGGHRRMRFTDREFYLARVRDEFRRNVDVTDPGLRRKLYERGKFIADNELGGLI